MCFVSITKKYVYDNHTDLSNKYHVNYKKGENRKVHYISHVLAIYKVIKIADVVSIISYLMVLSREIPF